MEKSEFTNIKHTIELYQQNLKLYLPALENEIKALVQRGNTDTNTIENTLDTLLSLTQMGIGKELFVQLIEYYKTLDPEGAVFYWNEYDTDDE